jgi:putative MATE family efflux protein
MTAKSIARAGRLALVLCNLLCSARAFSSLPPRLLLPRASQSANQQRLQHSTPLHHHSRAYSRLATSLLSSASSSASSSSNYNSKNKSNEQDLPKLKKKLTKEFFQIGAPALVQLAAEPLASLVDTAYLGRLGPEILGGAGVAVSAQYAVSKLYNDPLLRTSISLVAAQQGKARNSDADSNAELSVAVSSALLLAATVGLVQMIIYGVCCQSITRAMGVLPTSPMWQSAVSYLQIRSLGTPAATLWLVTNGIYRGLGDTRTPLVYSLAFTVLNIILDPLFIFTFKWGASGAAAGTALAQYIALVPLLLSLNRKVNIDIFGQFKQLKTSLSQYLKAGSLVLFRSFGKVLAYSVCARQAALLGPVAAAAYNLTFQLGFATTQICESVAVAVQTLLARELSDNTSHEATTRSRLIRHLITTSIWLGGCVAGTLSLTSYWRRKWIVQGLTTNTAVQTAAAGIFPAVMATQVLKGLAYPVNGIGMGGLDWVFSMVTMWAANLVCVGMIQYYRYAQGGVVSLSQIWWALAAFMGTQVILGILRVESKTGVWKLLRYSKLKPAQTGL